ncbi:bifunctional diaminohydroxyphosphoribosylaminopyrimidine deaminase/5-amino-6-(5-phosphoribosylamino)uracil reductase RibD [Banduia mediterranea]
MAQALRLAERGSTSTHPNPRVGCVVVRDGEIVGRGWHERAGEAHAEVIALRQAGDRARGAEVFVSLEPCAHHGRTPPCCEALVAAGVAKVWVAMEDPYPAVAGQGMNRLRGAGIEVDCGLMETEAESLNRGFLSRVRRGRPWLSLKLASSLDGRTAMASGESQWITGEAARTDVHRLRASAGAVLTSSATVLADNPALTVRKGLEPGAALRQPDRIVLDTQLRSPATAQVWHPDARRFALTVRPRGAMVDRLRAQGVEVHLVRAGPGGQVELGDALRVLGTAGVNSVLVECGPILAGAWLRSDLVDELVLYLAPLMLGSDARPMAQLPGLRQLSERVQLTFTDVRQIGSDLRIIAEPRLE